MTGFERHFMKEVMTDGNKGVLPEDGDWQRTGWIF
jgi:hypothetical protein